MDESNKIIPEGSSPLRFMLSDASGKEYNPIKDFEKAKITENAYLIMEADYGGQILLTCPMSKVKADYKTLEMLLADLEMITWGNGMVPEDNPNPISYDAAMYIEIMNPNTGVAGGMGGGVATSELWTHDELIFGGMHHNGNWDVQIIDVIEGKQKRLINKEQNKKSNKNFQ